MTAHSTAYLAHINSEKWRRIRLRILRLASYRCQRCKTAKAEEVHHLTYERLGHERDNDLQALCKPCHTIADQERAVRTYWRVEDARLDGWATKRWGEDWADRYDEDYAREKFEDWLERRQDW